MHAEESRHERQRELGTLQRAALVALLAVFVSAGFGTIGLYFLAGYGQVGLSDAALATLTAATLAELAALLTLLFRGLFTPGSPGD
jgi:hypothetical protein